MAGARVIDYSTMGIRHNTPAGIEGMFRHSGRDLATPRPDDFEITPAKMAEGAREFGQVILGPPR